MRVEVKRLDKNQLDSFYAIHCEKNGEGWCNCVAWWVPSWDGWGERSAEQNRELRESLFAKGEYDGYLLYVDSMPAGWSQVGKRDRLEKLCKQHSLAPDPTVWAITCLTIVPEHRKKGLAHTFLGEIVADLRGQGVSRIQAFPKIGGQEKDGHVWTGPESIYVKAGFRVFKPGAQVSVYEWSGR